jgi:hypothetical protein
VTLRYARSAGYSGRTVEKVMTKVLLFLIKLVQGLMLLSAMAAFGYGAFHLSQAA